MNREEIIRMAREAGFDAHDMSSDFTCNLSDIERFASLVAAAEREALPEEVCEAYGWLFHETSSERANRARQLLLTCMTKAQQKVGIQMAKEHGAVVRRMSTTRGGGE